MSTTNPPAAPTTLRLGGEAANRTKREESRGGLVVFESPRGLRRDAALLVEALPKRAPGRSLFGMDTEGAVALAAHAIWPGAAIEWCHLDAYVGAKVTRVLEANHAQSVAVTVDEDPPAGPFDLVALPFPAGAEALLMRDVLEAAHDRLRVGGRLVAATDGKPDALRKAVDKVFGNFVPSAARPRRGACFYAERRREKPQTSDHSHLVHVRIAPQAGGPPVEIEMETRPGTFSHGALDDGTRALAEAIEPGGADSVLDLGAGCGALGISLALRLPAARAVLVDSNARAAGCARRNAARNGVAERVEVLVRADVEAVAAPPGGFALCVSNPPYFGNWRIARSFIWRAHELLRPGGRFALVVRSGPAAAEHAAILGGMFGRMKIAERAGYGILTAVR
jgi:16S rRNA (guanine1207-N2)-methyltransferase